MTAWNPGPRRLDPLRLSHNAFRRMQIASGHHPRAERGGFYATDVATLVVRPRPLTPAERAASKVRGQVRRARRAARKAGHAVLLLPAQTREATS